MGIPLESVSRGNALDSYRHKAAEIDPEALAVEALQYVAGDPRQLERFLAMSGIDASDIRRAAGQPGFLAGVLDFLLGHEPTLLAFSAEAGIAPERVARARQALGRFYGSVAE